MTEYQVTADKLHKYIATVNAESPDMAWDMAKQLNKDMWQEVLSDDPIEPYGIEEV